MEVELEMASSKSIVQGLRWFQGLLATGAAITLAQPEMVTPFIPPQHQPKFMAGIALASALLPSLLGGPAGKGLAGGFVAGYSGAKGTKASGEAGEKGAKGGQDPESGFQDPPETL